MLPTLTRPITRLLPSTRRTMSNYLSSLPVSSEYAEEAKVAVAAVLRACHITQKVQKAIKKQVTEEKPDKSPVTGEWHEFDLYGCRGWKEAVGWEGGDEGG